MRVVAVFSGGGAKALASAGAFRALEEAGLPPSHIVATSMGAVVGAALAAGLTWKAVASAARALPSDFVAALNPLILAGPFAPSLLRADSLREAIERLVPARFFSDLRIPLTVTATDLDTGELALFGAGDRDQVPLHEALYASCALPVYYPPITIATRRYADGGLRAVLPLEAARRFEADLYVAVHVGPGFDEVLPPSSAPVRPPPPFLPPLVRAHGEAQRIMMAVQAEREIASWPCDGPKLVLVRPVKEKEATFRVQDAERYVEAGYRETKEALARQD